MLTRPDVVPAAGEVLSQDPAVCTPVPAMGDALTHPDGSAAAPEPDQPYGELANEPNDVPPPF